MILWKVKVNWLYLKKIDRALTWKVFPDCCCCCSCCCCCCWCCCFGPVAGHTTFLPFKCKVYSLGILLYRKRRIWLMGRVKKANWRQIWERRRRKMRKGETLKSRQVRPGQHHIAKYLCMHHHHFLHCRHHICCHHHQCHHYIFE